MCLSKSRFSIKFHPRRWFRDIQGILRDSLDMLLLQHFPPITRVSCRFLIQGSICAEANTTGLCKMMCAPLIQTITIYKQEWSTLQETNISFLGKQKIIFKSASVGNMLVPWRVSVWCLLHCLNFCCWFSLTFTLLDSLLVCCVMLCLRWCAVFLNHVLLRKTSHDHSSRRSTWPPARSGETVSYPTIKQQLC